MKSKRSIRSIIVLAFIGLISVLFINMSLAANTATISVETANLRETADENAKVIELLSKNQEVEILEKTGDWYKVKTEGMTGYLRQDLLSVKEEANTTGNTNTATNTTQDETKTTATQEMKLGKQKVAENTKLKIVPVINATDIIEVKKDEEVTVTEIINGWVCVETQNTKGWMRQEKLQKEQTEPKKEESANPVEEATIKTLFINTTTANLRKEANTSAEIVTSLAANTAVDVVAEQDGWSKVKVSGKEGYISSSLLSTTKQETSRASTTPRKAATQEKAVTKEEAPVAPPASGSSSSIVGTAKQYIGCRYVYGGTTPSGFDCSGFTSYVFRQHGISLSRTAAAQYGNGVAVSRGNLQPGDLIMFGPSASGINHVGIYIGGGMMVHAANPSRGVTTDTINSGYYNNNYVGARRIL